MQSEDLENIANSLEAPSSKSEMTYSDNVPDSSAPVNQDPDNIK